MVSISGPETVVEGTMASYEVRLTGGAGSAPIDVTYTVTGAAIEGVDYTELSEKKVQIGASSATNTITFATITIMITDDGVEEVPETLVVTLTDATTDKGTVILGDPKVATSLIRAIGTKTVRVEAGSAAEGEAVTLVVSLRNEGGETTTATGDVTLAYSTADGSAAAGQDYTAASGAMLVIPTGESTRTITVRTMEDDREEENETFTVRLTLVDGPDDVALEMSSATGTITDDEGLTLAVEKQQVTVVEGSDATFAVTLAGGSGSADVLLRYKVEGTAKSGDDYEPPSRLLAIPAGQQAGAITIRTLTDDVLEGNETITVSLTDVDTVGTITLPTDGTQMDTTTLRDSGDTVIVSVADASPVTEDDAAVFTVSLTGKVASNLGSGLFDYHWQRRGERLC